MAKVNKGKSWDSGLLGCDAVLSGWLVPEILEDQDALKISETIHPLTEHHSPEGLYPQQHLCENHKSCNGNIPPMFN